MLIRMVEDISNPTERDRADLSKVQEPYKELVKKYADIWPEDLPGGLQPLRLGVELVIPFDEDAVPVASYRVRYSPAKLEEARTQVKRFLEKGFVRPSTSPYGAYGEYYVHQRRTVGCVCVLTTKESMRRHGKTSIRSPNFIC